MAETPVFEDERCEKTEASLCVAIVSVCICSVLL
jgi:hypothetical protein